MNTTTITVNYRPKLDSHLLLKRCPHCSVDNPNLIEKCRFDTADYNRGRARLWVAYSCQRCGGVTTAWADRYNEPVREMFPSPVALDDSIPPRAKDYLNQAIDSLHAPAGATMLAASAIDSMLKAKGYKDDVLHSRINKAAKDHLITKEMAEWAHQVRLDANAQRHADDSEELPNESDAQKTIDFAMALAQFLFVMPSRIQQGIQASKT